VRARGVRAGLLDSPARDRRVAEGTWVLTVQLQPRGSGRGVEVPCRCNGAAGKSRWFGAEKGGGV